MINTSVYLLTNVFCKDNVMLLIRSLLFFIFLNLWTVLVSLVGTPLLFAPSKVTALVGHVWSNGVIFALRWICNLRYEVRGKEHLPEGKYIIASKHQSAWDTVIFLKMFRAPSYILKKELVKIPFYGWYLPAMGMIAIDRDGGASALKDMVKTSKKRLDEGRPVVIFPEGTRTLPGAEVEYQPGISALYMQAHVPIVPAAVNSGLFWKKGQFIKNPGKITLEYLPPIQPGLKRREFMEQLHTSIETASAKLINAD